jgi:hypothetical protein
MPQALPPQLPETGEFKKLYAWLNQLRKYAASLRPLNSYGTRTAHTAAGVTRTATPGR